MRRAATAAATSIRGRGAHDEAHARRRPNRRQVLAAPALAAIAPLPAWAAKRAPKGFRSVRDRLDGYEFDYPSTWVPVTSAGADVFYRNPEDPQECVFVDVSSPSSSKFESVRDLGTPRDAAEFVNQKLIDEFLSTRLGVRRKSEVLDAAERTASDGELYFDVAVRVRSYVDSNPLSPNPEDRREYEEWDRTLRTTLGVANGRLYSLRLQAPTNTSAESVARAKSVANSFRAFVVDPADTE